MPSVTSSIQQLCKAAPAAFQEEISEMLTDGGVLPNYKADVVAFKDTLQCINARIRQSLQSSGYKPHSQQLDVAQDESVGMSSEQPQNVVAVAEQQQEDSSALDPSGGRKQGQNQFRDYVRSTLARLNSPTSKGPEMSEAEFES